MHQILVLFEELVLEQLQALLITNPFLGLLLQHLPQEVLDSVAQGFLLVVDTFALHLRDSLWRDSFERIRAGQQFIEEQAQTVNVHSFVVSFLLYDLRRQILVTPTQFLHLFPRLYPRRKPEIADLHLSVLIEQDVLRLQIPINESFLMQADNPKGHLYPDQVFLSQSHPVILIRLLIALDGAVEISIHAKFLNEVGVSLVLHPIEQFHLVLGRILQDLVLVLYHEQVALVPALGLVDPLHAEELFIVLSFDQEDLGVGAFSDLPEGVEVIGCDEFCLAVDLELWVWRYYFKMDGRFDHPLDLRRFLRRHLILIEIQLVILCEKGVDIKIPGVASDDVVVQRLRGDLAIFDEMLQDFLAAEVGELRGVDDVVILWDFLVGVVGVDEREEHDCCLNIAIIKHGQSHNLFVLIKVVIAG